MADTTREAVKRFDPWRNADGMPHMKAVPNGAWVRWVDYCALLARAMPEDPPLPPDPNDEYIERIKALEAERDALIEAGDLMADAAEDGIYLGDVLINWDNTRMKWGKSE